MSLLPLAEEPENSPTVHRRRSGAQLVRAPSRPWPCQHLHSGCIAESGPRVCGRGDSDRDSDGGGPGFTVAQAACSGPGRPDRSGLRLGAGAAAGPGAALVAVRPRGLLRPPAGHRPGRPGPPSQSVNLFTTFSTISVVSFLQSLLVIITF